MNAKYHNNFRIFLPLLCLLLVALSNPAIGQSLDDNFVDSDEELLDEEHGSLGRPLSADDFSEGGRFVEDDRQGISRDGVTLRGRRTQLGLEQEREQLPLNAAWGAGTGLLIGGWFALIGNSDDRDTQRSIGLGSVLGALLGVFVGTQILIDPDAPRAAKNEPKQNLHIFIPVLTASNDRPKTLARIGLAFHF